MAGSVIAQSVHYSVSLIICRSRLFVLAACKVYSALRGQQAPQATAAYTELLLRQHCARRQDGGRGKEEGGEEQCKNSVTEDRKGSQLVKSRRGR